MTVQTQSKPSASGEQAVGGRQDLYLFPTAIKDSDGYNISYRNHSGSTGGCWISIARQDKPHHYWDWAPNVSGSVKLFITPEPRDVARFWVESKLAGVNLNVMSARANPSLTKADDFPAVEPSQERHDLPAPGASPSSLSSGTPYPLISHPHYRLTSCQLVGNKYIVQYERDLEKVGGEDHFYVGLYSAGGERLTWDWATGKNGTCAVERKESGAYLLYMACFFAADPLKTAFPVCRWNLG